nr:uncharacterized protein LOC131761549 [Kogia breviceps]
MPLSLQPSGDQLTRRNASRERYEQKKASVNFVVEAPTHNPGTGPRSKNLPFSNALGVRNHCNKTEPDALSPVPQVSFQSANTRLHRISVGTLERQRLAQPDLTPAKKPIPRPPGQEALWISPPVATRSRRPAIPPPTAERSQPAELRALHRPPGLLSVIPLHHLVPASPSVPGLRLPQETSSKGQEDGGQGNGHLSSRFPQALLLSLTFFKETELSSPQLRQGYQLRGAYGDRRKDPNKAPEASNEH